MNHYERIIEGIRRVERLTRANMRSVGLKGRIPAKSPEEQAKIKKDTDTAIEKLMRRADKKKRGGYYEFETKNTSSSRRKK